MVERVISKICEELNQAKYFSIVVDSTPEVSHTHQLTLVVRYVLTDGSSCERFSKFIPFIGFKRVIPCDGLCFGQGMDTQCLTTGGTHTTSRVPLEP